MAGTRVLFALLVCVAALDARKFYDDDPLIREPNPIPVKKAKGRKVSDIYDLFSHVLATPGQKHLPKRKVKAGDINTLGEVLEGAWYEKRHARRRMTLEQIAAGPGASSAPADGPWTILSAKAEGITPGFLVQDEKHHLYWIKFDPPGNLEMATAADVISSKLLYALGYHVPENYIVYLDRSRLHLGAEVTFRDEQGRKRRLTSRDVGETLTRVQRDSDGRMRATASRVVPGTPIGPYRYYGTRTDDPNDTVPHEHRRSLRGLHVFCAWLNHDDSRAVNSLDTVMEEGYVRHYLLDFGSTLGSASTKVNSPRSGYEQFFTWRSAAKEFFTLGLYVPKWSTVDYPDMPSVGRFSSLYFDPRTWTPEYPNPAFDNRLPDDDFWAAEQVMAFTDDEIRTAVKTGRYTDTAAERYVGDVLIERRNLIGRAYLSQPLSLSDIRIDGGRIAFNDLAVRHGYLRTPPAYSYSWFVFDNDKETRSPIAGATGAGVPRAQARYIGVDITAPGNESRRVTVYLRQAPAGYAIVGIDREL